MPYAKDKAQKHEITPEPCGTAYIVRLLNYYGVTEQTTSSLFPPKQYILRGDSMSSGYFHECRFILVARVFPDFSLDSRLPWLNVAYPRFFAYQSKG